MASVCVTIENDPPQPRLAALRFGRLAGCGSLAREECSAVLEALAAAASHAAPGRDARGMRMRLAHAFADAAIAARLGRQDAAASVRRAVHAGLALGQNAADLRRAAQLAAAGRLPEHDILQIALSCHAKNAQARAGRHA